MFCKAARALGSLFVLGKIRWGGVRGCGWGEPGAAQGAWRGEAVGHTDEGRGEPLWEPGFPRSKPQQCSVCGKARSSLEGSGRAWMEGTSEESGCQLQLD